MASIMVNADATTHPLNGETQVTYSQAGVNSTLFIADDYTIKHPNGSMGKHQPPL